jgi:DNA-binding HxlR family transcriptional regulator
VQLKLKATGDHSGEGGTEDINTLLERLGNQLSEPVMKSSARLIILISLAINRKLSFSDLMAITSLGKGSLSNHLDKLHENGLIGIKTVFRVNGPRISIEITEKGMEAFRDYSDLLKKIMAIE